MKDAKILQEIQAMTATVPDAYLEFPYGLHKTERYQFVSQKVFPQFHAALVTVSRHYV